MADGAVASSSTVTPATVESMDFEDKDAEQPGAVRAEDEEGPGTEGAEKETSNTAEKEAEIARKTENIEGPGNVGDA